MGHTAIGAVEVKIAVQKGTVEIVGCYTHRSPTKLWLKILKQQQLSGYTWFLYPFSLAKGTIKSAIVGLAFSETQYSCCYGKGIAGTAGWKSALVISALLTARQQLPARPGDSVCGYTARNHRSPLCFQITVEITF